MKVLSLFDGKYEVFSDGRIVSYARKTPRELKGKITREGYRMVLLYDENGKRLYRNVHRIVAQAFIPNINNLPEVNHKDGNKLNNSVENLEWISTQDNVLHCRDFIGSKNNKITMQEANEIRALKKQGVSNAEITKKYGIKKTEIRYIVLNKRWCANEV